MVSSCIHVFFSTNISEGKRVMMGSMWSTMELEGKGENQSCRLPWSLLRVEAVGGGDLAHGSLMCAHVEEWDSSTVLWSSQGRASASSGNETWWPLQFLLTFRGCTLQWLSAQSGVSLDGFESWLSHLSALWLGASDLTSLCRGFLIQKKIEVLIQQ